jgi:membrane complex biogenesis BtpA family protein
MKLRELFNQPKIIIGMIHLPALPGYKGYPGMEKLIDFALEELATLESNGIHGVLIENENDKPHSVRALPEVVAALSVITSAVVHSASVPVGVEVLLNDPKASLAIASASSAQFIRTDYFVDRMSRDQYGGEMRIDPTGVIEYRKRLRSADIAILADIQVKYAKMLEKDKPIYLSVIQAKNAHADAVLVSGTVTGESPDLEELIQAKKASKQFPVLLGSGFSADNAQSFLKYADGAIVGTSLKSKGRVDGQKVKELMTKVNEYGFN